MSELSWDDMSDDFSDPDPDADADPARGRGQGQRWTDRAALRARAYRLLGRLFATGPDADVRPLLHALPGLDELAGDEADPELLAAEHYRVFGHSVFPHESVFCGDGRSIGGAHAGHLGELYAGWAFPAEELGAPVDHVATELAFLGWLSKAESDWATVDRVVASEARDTQARFLDEHVLTWLPALWTALRQVGSPRYERLAELAVALVVEHREALAGGGRAVRPPAGMCGVEADAEAGAAAAVDARSDADAGARELLDAPDTTLRDIADLLCSPADAGWFLSRYDVEQAARRCGLPRGFGGRRLMLHNLLRSAADFGQIDDVVDELLALCDRWTKHLHDQAADSDVTAPFVARRIERLASTCDALLTLRAAAPVG